MSINFENYITILTLIIKIIIYTKMHEGFHTFPGVISGVTAPNHFPKNSVK